MAGIIYDVNTMNKRIVTTLLLGTPLLATSLICQKQEKKPNFIIFIADDMSIDDPGCYGNPYVQTPNIDRLAESGIKFSNVFLTASSSSPSRNSLITGRYPHNTGGAELHTLPPDFMTGFPELLRQNGYYSVQAGKFHMGPYARRSFDKVNDDGKLNGDGGEELWVKCLEERPRDKPFFMWFAAMDPHRPWGPNEFSGTHRPGDIRPPFYLADEPGTREDLAKFYDEIKRFDHYIGEVVSELKKQGAYDNTLIIIMADNGRPFPHSKTRVNDRGLKSPFIVHWPGGIGVKPKDCHALVSSMDIAPSILELASVPVPETIQGKSFVKLLKNPSRNHRKFVFAEHNWHDYEAHQRMVRTKDFLYILNSRPQFLQAGPADAIGSPSYADLDSLFALGKLTSEQAEIFQAPRPAEELYHCTVDPDQFNNVANSPEYSGKKKQLNSILLEWMEVTGDNIPENLTKDWYERMPGYVKTPFYNIRGEPVDKKFNATQNNNKGRY